MSKSLRNNLLKYGISLGLSLALAWFYVSSRMDLTNLSQVSLEKIYLNLCDAFSIPGLLLLMSGLLMSVSNAGALDGVGYLAVNALRMLIPGGATKVEKYKEYVERRRANRPKGYGFLYISAAICLVIAGIFMILFYSVYQK